MAARAIHLYPFPPRGRHGGTLRLAGALAGTELVAETELHHYDPGTGAWVGPLEPVAARQAEDRSAATGGRSVKRALFPSTLWESGRRPRRALRGHLGALRLSPDAILVLHTSYLAGVIGELGRRVPTIVDVYDLVWSAHATDAAAGPLWARPVRGAYSASVRAREQRAIARADDVLVAGFEDRRLLAERLPATRWVPTATPVEAVAPRERDGAGLRVGLLGNFRHQSTLDSARRLLAAPLADGREITIVLAGLGSDAAFEPRPGIEVLGACERVEDFYEAVDCVAAPVGAGSGIKVKLGESLLAGRPVVTTAAGAAGYPPHLRALMTVADPDRLDPDAVRGAVARFDPGRARELAGDELDPARIAGLYAEAVDRVTRGARGSAPT